MILEIDDEAGWIRSFDIDLDVTIFEDTDGTSEYTDVSAIQTGQECEIFFGPDGEVDEIVLFSPAVNYCEGIIEAMDLENSPNILLKILLSDGTTMVLAAYPDIADFSYDQLGEFCTFTRDPDGVIDSIIFENQ